MRKRADDLERRIAALEAHITDQEDLECRIAALEAHITDLEERLNERGVFSGDLCTCAWQASSPVAER